MYNALRTHLDTLYPLADVDWAVFVACLENRSYAKNEILLRAGQVCRDISFIASGSFRSYQLNDGVDVSTAFFFEQEFVTDYESLTKQQPSSCTITALEAADVISFSRHTLIGLYQQAPGLMHVGRLILENLVVQKSQYASLFTLLSPAERYGYLLQHQPHIIQRVPLHYVASYLGMARETLSRIRQKK